MKVNYTTAAFILAISVIVFGLYFNGRNTTLKDYATGTKLYQIAPDFESEYTNGTKFKLSELRGKPVILNFWATWCPPCVREMPELNEFYNKQDKITVIGVNLQQDKKTIEEFARKLNISFQIVLDKTGEVESKYNLLLKPTTYFIDKNGVIVDKKLGELTREDLIERSKKILR